MRFKFFILFLLTHFSLFGQHQLPEGFSDIQDSIPNIHVQLKYTTNDNFIGRPIDGYHASKAILSTKAIQALQHVQKELNPMGLGLKVFDAYRPQRAVDHFVHWAKDINDTIVKASFYPNIDKRDLFRDGYIALKSGHSRGSTIDVTLISLSTAKELDMGTSFDFFGEKSNHQYPKLSKLQKKNRKLLRSIMEKHGFKAYEKEWWHYTLEKEPFPDTYFDFPIQ